jgi:glycosyltransferase involved in cell wall biosynthesis
VKLTVTVITYNEASHIADALASVAWADEIIVVDSHSTDGTASIAKGRATRVEVRDWPGYSAQKNYAADLASNDWVLSLDADERVSPALADEIRTLMSAGPAASGYRVPRVSWYLGRWVRSTDWYPDYQLRLYDRRAGRWNGRRVHESVRVSGPTGQLRHELLHYPYRDISDHLETMDRYTTLAAEQWAEEGRRASAWQALVYPRLTFLRNYILKGGFRDGKTGLVISLLNSEYVFLKYAKLLELQGRASNFPAGTEPPAPSPESRAPAREA